MKRLMTHLVVGSQAMTTTKRMIDEMITREIAAIELQIPFSDPLADGPVLMSANDKAVRNGVSADAALGLIQKGTTQFYLMSYLQPILHYGPETFFRRALQAGCRGFIIPDLPFDAPEAKTFLKNQSELRERLVPVLSPGMPMERLEHLFQTLNPRLVYLTARQGITGEHTAINNNLTKTIQTIRKHTKADIAVGFGIQAPADVQAVLKSADLAVIGSAFTRALGQSDQEARNLLDKLCKVA